MAIDDARTIVLELLLSDAPRAEAAARLVAARQDWRTCIDICSQWGVLPRLAQRLAVLGVEMDGAARDTLRRWTRASFFKSAGCLHDGVRAATVLTQAGVAAVAIKGVAAIATVYSGPGDRTIGDADLVVRERDRDAAVEALLAAGFRFKQDLPLADQVHLARKAAHDANRALDLIAPGGGMVDLHWQMGRLAPETILARAVDAPIYGSTIRVASRVHGFLLAAYHAIRSGYVAERASRDIVDCERWLAAIAEHREIDALVREATDCGLLAPALATCRVLAHFDPHGPSAACATAVAAGATAAEQREASDLAHLFLSRHPEAVGNHDLMLFLYPELLVQMVRRMATGRSEYPWLKRNDRALDRGAPPLGMRLRKLGSALRHADWQHLRALKRAWSRAARDRDEPNAS